MKTWNRFKQAWMSNHPAGVLAMTVVAALCATKVNGQPVTFLSTETFQSWPPSGWSGPFSCNTCGGWYYSDYGDGGMNSSAGCDIWDYSSSPLTTPSFDVSGYNHPVDSVWVDFDLCWEYSAISQYYPDDYFEIYANSDQLLKLATSTDYTYYDPNDYYYAVDPPTDPTEWRHYHVLIPMNDRTSNLSISFQGDPSSGITNPAIDNVTITGLYTPPGELSLLPNSLNFGTADPNNPQTLCVTAYSAGTAPLHINGINLTGSSAYTLVSGPAVGDSIMPGNSAQYCIQFLPLSPGTLRGTFTLITSGLDSGTQAVSLTGTGDIPTVSYSGASYFFRGVRAILTDTSPVEYITVSSTGQEPIQFNNIYFTGLNANDYFVAHMPQNPLPPNTTDSIGIQFSPTIEGRPDAALIIGSNALNIPLDTVPLFGIGTLPHLVIGVPAPGSGNTVMFDSVAMGDSVCQTITLTNTGTDTLHILKQLVTYGDYDFSFYPLTGLDTILAPGASRLATVCFKPIMQGAREASIRFYTNIPPTFEKPRRDTSQFVVNITGVGVPYGMIALNGSLNDTAELGNSNCLSDTVINSGTSDVTITRITVSGLRAQDFSITGMNVPVTLLAGEHRSISICYSPAIRGTMFDTLILSGSTKEKPITEAWLLQGDGLLTCASGDSVAFFGTDSMTMVGASDTSCITVTNCGDVPATYTAQNPAGASYALLPPAFGSTATEPGQSTQFCVVFAPTSLGTLDGSVTITGGPAPVITRLSGVGAGVVASATGALSGPVTLGQSQTFTVTITNNGNIPWAPGTGVIGGTNATDFSIQSGPNPAVIPAGGTATAVINFAPTINGTEMMTLTFPNANPAPLTAFNFNATGEGSAEAVALRTEQNGFVLGQSYPNPTTGLTAIPVTVPMASHVRIDLLNATGEIVRTAFTGTLNEGTESVALDATGLSSGTYFYRLTSGNTQLLRQMTLLK